jgi:Derlin-2/3
MSLTYLSCSLAPPDTRSPLVGAVTVPAFIVPYTMIAMDLVLAGRVAAMQSAIGAVVGHIWWWCVWGRVGTGTLRQVREEGVLAGLAEAPDWMRRLMGEIEQRRRNRPES